MGYRKTNARNRTAGSRKTAAARASRRRVVRGDREAGIEVMVRSPQRSVVRGPASRPSGASGQLPDQSLKFFSSLADALRHPSSRASTSEAAFAGAVPENTAWTARNTFSRSILEGQKFW